MLLELVTHSGFVEFVQLNLGTLKQLSGTTHRELLLQETQSSEIEAHERLLLHKHIFYMCAEAEQCGAHHSVRHNLCMVCAHQEKQNASAQ